MTTDEQYEKVREIRARVPSVNEDTIMQMFLTPGQAGAYLFDKDAELPQVISGVCYNAYEVCPHITCGEDAKKHLLLDFCEPDMYVVRFTLKPEDCPSNQDIPAAGPQNNGFGFAPSGDYLIPEYYLKPSVPTDGAIYIINKRSEEVLAGIWNKEAGRFDAVY